MGTISRKRGDRTRSVAHREGAGNGKQHDLLSSPLFGDGVVGDWESRVTLLGQRAER